jgi:hypothetical protein
MTRRGRGPYQTTRSVDLENIKDTESTTSALSPERQRKQARRETSEKADPPFRGSQEKEPFITEVWVVRFLKFGTAIIGFFVTIVLPAVWYASKLDSRVDTLQVDVRDIKQKTEDLVKNSVQHGGRIDVLERTYRQSSVWDGPQPIDQVSAKQTATPNQQ